MHQHRLFWPSLRELPLALTCHGKRHVQAVLPESISALLTPMASLAANVLVAHFPQHHTSAECTLNISAVTGRYGVRAARESANVHMTCRNDSRALWIIVDSPVSKGDIHQKIEIASRDIAFGDVPGYHTKTTNVHWLDRNKSTREEPALELLQVEPKPLEEKTFGQQTVNEYESQCVLYFVDPVNSPIDCPYEFDPVELTPKWTEMNIQIKSAVASLIAPCLETLSGVFTEGQKINLEIANLILLETSSGPARGLDTTARLKHVLVGSVVLESLQSLFDAAARPKPVGVSLDLPPSTLSHIAKHIQTKSRGVVRHVLATEQNEAWSSESAAAFLETGAEAAKKGAPLPLAKGTWAHKGNPGGVVEKGTSKIKDLGKDMVKILGAKLIPRLASLLALETSHFLEYPVVETVTDSVVAALVATVPTMVQLAAGPAIADTVSADTQVRLVDRITLALVNTLTRSLTHAVGGSLAAGLSMSTDAFQSCYYCSNFGSLCRECHAQTGGRGAAAQAAPVHLAHAHAAYYSDYYAGYFGLEKGQSVFDTMGGNERAPG